MKVIILLMILSVSTYAYEQATTLCHLSTPTNLYLSECFDTFHEGNDPNSAEMQAMRICMSWALNIAQEVTTITNYDRVTFLDDPKGCHEFHDELDEMFSFDTNEMISTLQTAIYKRHKSL